MNAVGKAPTSAADTTASQAVTPWLVVVLAVILLSGALFGYDQGVISGALHGIKATFSLSALLVEVVTSWVTLGALFGALALQLHFRLKVGAIGLGLMRSSKVGPCEDV